MTRYNIILITQQFDHLHREGYLSISIRNNVYSPAD